MKPHLVKIMGEWVCKDSKHDYCGYVGETFEDAYHVWKEMQR